MSAKDVLAGFLRPRKTGTIHSRAGPTEIHSLQQLEEALRAILLTGGKGHAQLQSTLTQYSNGTKWKQLMGKLNLSMRVGNIATGPDVRDVFAKVLGEQTSTTSGTYHSVENATMATATPPVPATKAADPKQPAAAPVSTTDPALLELLRGNQQMLQALAGKVDAITTNGGGGNTPARPRISFRADVMPKGIDAGAFFIKRLLVASLAVSIITVAVFFAWAFYVNNSWSLSEAFATACTLYHGKSLVTLMIAVLWGLFWIPAVYRTTTVYGGGILFCTVLWPVSLTVLIIRQIVLPLIKTVSMAVTGGGTRLCDKYLALQKGVSPKVGLPWVGTFISFIRTNRLTRCNGGWLGQPAFSGFTADPVLEIKNGEVVDQVSDEASGVITVASGS